MEIGKVILDLIAPIFLIVGVGCLAKKNNWSLGDIALKVLLPGLSLLSIQKAQLSVDFIQIVACAWIIGIVQCLTSWSLSRLLSLDKATQIGFILAIVGVNSGNFGIPFNKFALGGQDTETMATVAALAATYYVAWSVFFQPVAALIGRKDDSDSLRDALRKIATMPILYASLVGLALNLAFKYWHVSVPSYLFFLIRSAEMFKDAAPTMMLIVLGTKLYETRRHEVEDESSRTPLVIAVALRLLVGPVFALILAHLMDLEGLTRDVVIISSSAPTAVQAALFARDKASNFVNRAVLASTAACAITLPFIVYYLLPWFHRLGHFNLFAYLAK